MSGFENNSFPPRPELDRIEIYKAGLSIDQIQRQHGIKKLIKLASNENPLGPSPKAVSAYKEVMEKIFRYPETKSIDLRWCIAEKFKLDIARVIVGNGSDEIIELLAKAYLNRDTEVIVSATAFMQYKIAGQLMGAHVVSVPLNNMKVDLQAMANAVTPKTKLIFIANPNNPTGTYNTKWEVETFLSRLPPHVLPVFDEAYFEFACMKNDYPSMADSFKKNFLFVLRTFSKVYGLAGLRIGYGIGPEHVIEALDRIRPPFNVSIPAQAAAQAALFDMDHIKKSVSNNEKERDVLSKALIELGFGVIPSAANFILFNVRPRKGRALFEKILEKGIITRAVDEYDIPDYLRVTIGKPDENKMFLSVLREVLNEP